MAEDAARLEVSILTDLLFVCIAFLDFFGMHDKNVTVDKLLDANLLHAVCYAVAQRVDNPFRLVQIRAHHTHNFEMQLIFDIPVDYAVQLLSKWLTLRNICDLEVAMCSVENRLRLGSIYEALVIECRYVVGNVEKMEKQLDWLVFRRIRVSSLRVEYPLPSCSLSKITALLKHSATQLFDLDLNENDISLKTIAVAVSRYCPRIKIIEVADMVLCAPFFAMLGTLQNLKDLIFFQCDKLDVGLLRDVSCPSVQTLTINGDYSIECQEGIVRMCPNLVNYTVQSETIEIKDMPSTLRVLEVEWCTFFRIINLNTYLRKVKLCGYDIEDDQIAGMFSSCPYIQVLELPSKHHLTDVVARKIGDTYGPVLTVLDLFDWERISSAAVQYVCKKCTALTSLTLGGRNQHFDWTHIVLALDNCVSLRALSLLCGAVPDAVLTRIAAAPLETLDMHFFDGITETGIMELVNGCATLKKIKLEKTMLSPLVKMMWKKLRPDLEFQ